MVQLCQHSRVSGAVRCVLKSLDPHCVADELLQLGDGRVPVMLFYENAAAIQTGTLWCHRHLAAQWLEDRLGIEVEEVGHPELDRFAKLRLNNVTAPIYK